MRYVKTHVSLGGRPTGEPFSAPVYTFEGSGGGRSVYLQGNLHGPEVFGTALLTALVQEFEKWDQVPGTVTIVPCANPLGVQETAYNTHLGRWNSKTGLNWNGIFTAPTRWSSREEERAYYAQRLISARSIEERLEAELRSLSSQADVCIDIHTNCRESIEHVMTLDTMSTHFESLGAPVHLVQTDEKLGNSFEESHYHFTPEVLPEDRPWACTWEVSSDGLMFDIDVRNRLVKLLNWFAYVWQFDSHISAFKPEVYWCGEHLYATDSGYLAWTKRAGEYVCAGDVYAKLYHPNSVQVEELKAEHGLTLIALGGVVAVTKGDRIAWIGYNP